MELNKKAAYLQGLVDGLGVDESTKEGKIIKAMAALLGEMADAIAAMKRGVRVINLARGEIVDDDAMLAALDTGWVAAYVTDFPNNRLVGAPHVLAMPHLGASTPESEQNCAVMAVDQLRDYLENGNIRNSVNLPAVSQERSGVCRLCLIHKNVPAMLASITTLLSRDGINVENLSNKSRGDYAYTCLLYTSPSPRDA